MMAIKVDPDRAGKTPAVSAAQKYRMLAHLRQHAGHRQRQWCLAGPTECRIANTYDRHIHTLAAALEPPRRHCAVDRCRRRKQFGLKASRPPPEWRLTHGCPDAPAVSASDRVRAPQWFAPAHRQAS